MSQTDAAANNAMKKFFKEQEGAWKQSAPQGVAVFPDGNYKLTPVKVEFRPKPNDKSGAVYQVFWTWKSLAGDLDGKLYKEYNDLDTKATYFGTQLAILKERIERLGYDSSQFALSELQDQLNTIVVDQLVCLCRLTTKISDKINPATGEGYKNQQLYINEVLDEPAGGGIISDEFTEEDRAENAATQKVCAPDKSPAVQQPAAPTPPVAAARRAGRPTKAAAAAIAAQTPVVAPAAPPAPVIAPEPVVLPSGDEDGAGVEPQLGMRVQYKIFGRNGEETVTGEIVEIPEDESIDMQARRDGTMRNDVLDDESEWALIVE